VTTLNVALIRSTHPARRPPTEQNDVDLVAGPEARIDFHLPYPARAAWGALRDAVASHPSVLDARFNDIAMRAELRTTAPSYTQHLTAVVTANGYSTHIEISSAIKRWSLGGGDSARIRKVATDLHSDVVERLNPAAG
jgi:hypothetical protein